jgi:protein TonB
MSASISSALEKLDGSLLALQSEVDCLRAGLEVSDEQLRQRLAEARQHATAVREVIRAERADAKWGDREALDLLILELEIAAQEKVNEQRRTRLLELASEFEAGSIKHRFESRVSALNALRQEAVDQLRADAALKDQEKVLPGPDAGEWLGWACNLQEDSDASTLDQLQKDFPALAGFTGEMEESYWVPGTRAAVTPAAVGGAVAQAPAPAVAAKAIEAPKQPAPPTPAVQAAKPPAPPAPAVQAPKPPAPPAPAVQAAKPPAPPTPAVQAAKPPAPPAPAVQVAKQPAPPAPVMAKAQEPVTAEPVRTAGQPAVVETPVPPVKKSAPEPVVPARSKVAVATVAVPQEKPQPAVTAKAQETAPVAPPAERPAKEARPAAEPVRPSAPAKQWAAAAAPAKEPAEKEKKTVAAATVVAPPVAAAPRMKYCDKCGSTYPAQFNVCPIDTSPLRFADEPRPAVAAVANKVEGAVVAATAATAAQVISKSRTAEQAAVEKSRESSKVEVSELRATFRHQEEEHLAAGEHRGTDWQALLRDKNWHALAANPVVLAAATLVLILVVGGIVWKAHRSHVANDSVRAMEKAPDQPAASAQPGLVTNSVAQPVGASPSTANTSKPTDQNANKQNAQPGKDTQPKPESENPPKQADVLSLPMPGTRDVAVAKKPEPPANDAIEPPTIPGALSNTSSNLGAIAKDVPVAVPTLSQQKLRVSSGVAQAQLTHRVNPLYPPEAFQSRVHGTVVLQAVIGKDGEVKTLKVVSGPPMLIKSATEAVKQWRYKPFTLNGEPVEADTQVNVNFSLGQQ